MTRQVQEQPSKSVEGVAAPLKGHSFPESPLREAAQQEQGPSGRSVRGLTFPVAQGQDLGRITDPAKLAATFAARQGDPEAVTTLAHQIRAYGDARCVDGLVEYVTTNRASPEKMTAVASCLQALGSIASTEAIPHQKLERAFVPFLRADEPGLRREALFALGFKGHPEALAELTRIRTDPSEDAALRLRALDFVPAERERILEDILKSKDLPPKCEAEALWSLYRREGPFKNAAMERLLDGGTPPEVKAELLRMGVRVEGTISDEAIVAACGSPEPPVVQGAVYAASVRGAQEGPGILRDALTRVPNEGFSRVLLLEALAQHGAPEDRARFESILNDPTVAEHGVSLRYFAKADPAHALSTARASVARHADFVLHPEALEVLAASESPEDLAAIVDKFPRLDTYRCDAVLEALSDRGRSDIIKSLRQTELDPSVRHKVVRALAVTGDQAALTELSSNRGDRFERQVDFAALARSPTEGALRVVQQQMSNGDFLNRNAIAQTVEASPATFSRFVTNLTATKNPELVQWADDIVRARALDIEHPLRLRPEDLHHVTETRRSFSPPVAGERQALVVLGREDRSGAFNGIAPVVQDLRENGYRIVLFEASSETEVVAALAAHERYGKNDFIMFGAHGTRESMSFGGEDPARGVIGDETLMIDLSDRAELKTPGVQGSLKAGGHIMLMSCSTGEGGAHAENVANMLRDIFPHAAAGGISAPRVPAVAQAPLEFNAAGYPVQVASPWLRYYLAEASTPVQGAEGSRE